MLFNFARKDYNKLKPENRNLRMLTILRVRNSWSSLPMYLGLFSFSSVLEFMFWKMKWNITWAENFVQTKLRRRRHHHFWWRRKSVKFMHYRRETKTKLKLTKDLPRRRNYSLYNRVLAFSRPVFRCVEIRIFASHTGLKFSRRRDRRSLQNVITKFYSTFQSK